ncbi:MAG: hypothetical protein HFF79_02260 [Oscillospiraceae bacterium]|nr:hypothetical protein [Oscillospiraceae bacterium]
MIDLDSYSIFADHHAALRETSLDDRDGRQTYMTQSPLDAISFDDVKTDYVKNLGLSEIPKSNDALFKDSGGSLIFVEFKNGFMDRAKQFAVRKKIYDSVLIFTDITSKKISDLRTAMKYILVYNESVNMANTSDRELIHKQKAAVQPSQSFDCFAKTVGRYAHEEYICFGLKIFQNYCFKEVHTFTEQEFEKYLTNASAPPASGQEAGGY